MVKLALGAQADIKLTYEVRYEIIDISYPSCRFATKSLMGTGHQQLNKS